MPLLKRRTVLSGAIAASALAFAGGAPRARLSPGDRTDVPVEAVSGVVVILDADRGAGVARLRARAKARGWQVREAGRDPAVLWDRQLRPIWDGRDVAVLGLTSPATAFCLDLLARDAGYVTVWEGGPAAALDPGFDAILRATAARVELRTLPHSPADGALVSWLIRRMHR